jgi:EpsI family protein
MRIAGIGHRFFVVALALGVGGAALRLDASTGRPVHMPTLEILTVPNAEIVGDERLDEDTERVLQADSYLLRSYEFSGAPVDVLVAFYASQESGHTIHSPLNCLPGTGWTWSSRDLETIPTADGRTITVNRNIATLGGDQLLVYYWYQSRGRVTASDYRNKFLLVRDALLLHRSDGALVRVTTPWPVDAEESAHPAAFVRDLYSTLTKQLPE